MNDSTAITKLLYISGVLRSNTAMSVLKKYMVIYGKWRQVMRIEELEQRIEGYHQTLLRPMRENKGHDYSGLEDTLTNLRPFGWPGVVVRIGDKWNRLLTLTKGFLASGEIVTKVQESMKDTILDTINYLFILLVMMDDWLGHESPAVINRKEVKSIYLAHYVRGNTEEFRQASELEREMIMQQNVTEAIKHGQKLRESFPNIRFYIPGEHEDVYSQAYIDGVISADDIINQCEDIVGLCDMFVTMANPEHSEGVQREMFHAKNMGIPCLELWKAPKEKYSSIIQTHLENN